MPSVDILVPHHNNGEGFLRTLRSVQNQTWDGTFRIVVADDGSEARELSAVRDMLDQAEIPSLVVANSENRGRPYTRNVLLDHMDSDFVAWLDSGDEWYPEKINRQLDILHAAQAIENADMVWATCSYDWCQADLPPRPMRQNSEGDLVRSLLAGRELRAYLWTILAPRAAMEVVGYFDENLPRLQDLDFFIRFALKGGKLVQPDDRSSLCVYIKEHRGRSAREINACNDYLKEKYAYLFARYGSKFVAQCDYRAAKNSARFARANGDQELARTFRRRARHLKLRLWTG